MSMSEPCCKGQVSEQRSENLQTGKRNTGLTCLLQVFAPMGRPVLSSGLTTLSFNPKGHQHWLPRLRNAKAPVPSFQYLLCVRLITCAVTFDSQKSYKMGAMYDSHFTDEKIEVGEI